MPFAHFGTLAADSSNVVELIRDIYNVIFMYCGHIALILSFGHIFKQFRIYVMKLIVPLYPCSIGTYMF